MSKSISRFDDLTTLMYSVQKEDGDWPSIVGLAYNDYRNTRGIKLIAEIEEIVE